MMRYRHLEIFCSDTSASKLFFVDALGFELEEEQPGGFVWLKSGEAEFLLRPGLRHIADATTYQETAQAIVLVTEDLKTARTRLAENGIAILGTDGSPECLTFKDPDGHWFQLIEG